MTTSLAPAAALAWLGSVVAGLRAAAVLGSDGALLVGDARLARRAALALAAAPSAGALRDGSLLAVRGRRRSIAVELASSTPPGLTIADLCAALDALEHG